METTPQQGSAKPWLTSSMIVVSSCRYNIYTQQLPEGPVGTNHVPIDRVHGARVHPGVAMDLRTEIHDTLPFFSWS